MSGTAPANLHFLSDATSAIQTSLQNGKPLLMLITDETEECNKWISERFSSANDKFDQISRYLLDKYVLLRILKSGQDFKMLVQLFPQFVTVQVPAALAVFRGRIVDMIPQNLTVDEFNERIQGLDGKMKSHISNASNASNPTPAPSSSDTARSVNTGVNNSSTNNAITTDRDSIPSQPINTMDQARRNSAAAREKYQRDIFREENAEEEERKRIIRLVKLDREQKKREEMLDKGEEVERPAHENIHNVELERQRQFTIQVKLLNGKSVRAKFFRNDPLSRVRAYIIDQFPDYQTVPFHFYRSVDRVTYSDQDESKSLAKLNMNRATLLLKPTASYHPQENIQNETENEEAGGIGASAAGTFNWLKDTIGSYIWGQPANPPVAHNSPPLYHDATDSQEERQNRYSVGNGTEMEMPRKDNHNKQD